MTVIDANWTKLDRLLSLHPKAHVIIRNERLILYERIVETALSHGLAQELIAELRTLEPTEDGQ